MSDEVTMSRPTRDPDVPNIRVGVLGYGSLGKEAVRLLQDQSKAVTLVGIATRTERKPLEVDEDGTGGVPFVVGLGQLMDLRPDVIIQLTAPTLEDAAPDIITCLENGISVVSTCEELAYPISPQTALAKRIAEASAMGGAAALGTGINPGFIFDRLVATLSSTSGSVDRVECKRVVDMGVFTELVHRRIGIGLTTAEFDEQVSHGFINGHVGFHQSAQYLADAFGWGSVQVTQQFEGLVLPYVTQTPYGDLQPGTVVGVRQVAVVSAPDGATLIQFELIMHLDPAAIGLTVQDIIHLVGQPTVTLTVDPGMAAASTGAAAAVNAIPWIYAAEPRLYTLTDVVPITVWQKPARPAQPGETRANQRKDHVRSSS